MSGYLMGNAFSSATSAQEWSWGTVCLFKSDDQDKKNVVWAL